MVQEGVAACERTGVDVKEPGRYVVMLYNDDITPMDFVMHVLKSVFFKQDADAEAIMLKAHHEGKAVVGAYCYDIAQSKVNRALEMIAPSGYPLKLECVPE